MVKVMAMPKSTQQIVDHAAKLADQFEAGLIPGPDAKVTVTPLGHLYDAVQKRAAAEQEVAQRVAAARAEGTPWRVIGLVLGTSAQAARQRYG
jgi:hypothetical protein